MSENRRKKLITDLRIFLKEHGVTYVCSDLINSTRYIKSFVIDYDDGSNWGDNIEVTAEEIFNYIIKCNEKDNTSPKNDINS